MYEKLISLENLFLSWDEFKDGKMKKIDILTFERYLEDNIFVLHNELKNQTYRHGPYKIFHIHDPKHRIISKATVKDRLVHHLVFKKLYKIFEPSFIYHSYSSINDKGTHLAVRNLSHCLRKVSKNYTHNAYVLKCDIKKFFRSISHQKLFGMIKNRVSNPQFLWLIEEVIQSFSVPVDKKFERERELKENCLEIKGLPIGNITSQIFANIYLNKLDWFVKQGLRIKYYFRYADDFIIVHKDVDYLEEIKDQIQRFLKTKLNLELHPNKVQIRKFRQGIDFLGYVILPHYIVLRTKTKQRMFRKLKQNKKKLAIGLINQESFEQSLQSYLGMLQHSNNEKIKRELLNYAIIKENNLLLN